MDKGCWNCLPPSLHTFSNTKPQHRVSWRRPRSKHWHQLDLVITMKAALNSVLLTRSYHRANCDTDHSMVCTRVCLKPRLLHRSRQVSRTRLDSTKMANPDVRARLADSLDHLLEKDPSQLTAAPLEEKWTFIRDSICNTDMSVVGKKGRRNQDWFELHRCGGSCYHGKEESPL